MYVIIIGHAAAGKTSIAKRLSKYGILINLDAASSIEADIDIRKWIRVEDIQREYKLGINGALLKSMELIASSDEWICKDKEKIKIVDTPGQLEIFLYHDYGKKVVNKLSIYDAIAAVFVVDALEAVSLENYLAMLSQNAMINLRLAVPVITVINKIDLVDRKEIMKFLDRENIEKNIEKGDALLSLAKGLLDYVEYTSLYQRPLLVSAKTGEGIDDLYSALHEVHCSCGDIS